jgi:hypothetical protein
MRGTWCATYLTLLAIRTELSRLVPAEGIAAYLGKVKPNNRRSQARLNRGKQWRTCGRSSGANLTSTSCQLFEKLKAIPEVNKYLQAMKAE